MDDHTLDFAFIDGQVEEFEKLAFNPLKLTQAGKGRALSSLIGGALGGAAGAATAEEGQRGKGAIRGAIAGGLLGTGVGQVSTGQGQRQIGRALQRQAHGLTGYMPGAYQKEKGILSAFGKGLDPKKRVEILQKMRMDVPGEEEIGAVRKARSILSGVRQRARPEELLEKSELGAQKLQDVQKGTLTRFLPERVQRGLATMGVKRQVARLDQAEKGLTAAPQFLKNLATDPLGTARTGVLAAGGVGTALPLAMSVPQIAGAVKERDPEALGASLAETGFYAVSGGLPMLGSMALGSGALRLGGLPGSTYKRIMGKKPAQDQQQLPPQYAGYPTGSI